MTLTQSATVRFIHTSDWQLGMHRGFLATADDSAPGGAAEAQARFDAARLDAVKALGELASAEDAEFIVVAGDVFDYNSLSPRTEGRIWEVLRQLPVPVYLLPGNHDPLVADSIFHKTDELDGVYYFSSTEPVVVRPGVELIGAPLKAIQANRDLVAEAIAAVEPSETIRIVVGHGQTESRESVPRPDTIDIANIEQKIKSGAIDYVAMGDTHSTQQLSDTGAVWFSGSPEVTAFNDLDTAAGGEHDSGNALIVDITKNGPKQADVTVRKEHVGTWRFETFIATLHERSDVDHFISRLEAYENKERTVVKYGLQGSLSLEDHRVLQENLNRLRPVFAALYLRDRTTDIDITPTEEDIRSANLSGFVHDAMSELVERMTYDETAKDAASLLYRLAKKGA